MTYDALGRKESLRYFDASDNRTTHKIDGSHGWDAQYDPHGNRTLKSFVDIEDRLFVINDGYAKIQKTYDVLGREKSVRYLDTAGQRTTDKSLGHYGSDLEYDLPGSEVNQRLEKTISFFDPATAGFSELRESFDPTTKTSILSIYDAKGNKLRNPSHGALDIKTVEFGNSTVTEYLDCDGRLGSSKVVVTKNADGLVREEHFDVDGKPAFTSIRDDIFPKCSVFETQDFTTLNNEVTQWFSGFQENRSYTKVQMVVNESWGIRRFTFHTPDGQQVSNEAGIGSILEHFEPDLTITERAFFDLQDKRVVSSEDYHRAVMTPGTTDGEVTNYFRVFDQYDNEIRSILMNKNNELILQPDGFAYHRRAHDLQGRITTDRYFGLDNQAAANWLGEYGIKHEYDATGKEVRSFALGPDGTIQPNSLGISGYEYHYDESDQLIDNIYIDEAGNPKQAVNGVSGIRFLHLQDSTKLEYYGKEKQPIERIGLVVVKVLEDSNASKAGIELGDVILEVNQKKLRSHDELREEVKSLTTSESIREYPIKIMRKGNVMKVSLPTGQLEVETEIYYGVEPASEDKD
jgi:hypothetical protein